MFFFINSLSMQANPYDIHSNLSAILRTYGVDNPPPHVSPTMVLDKIITKVNTHASCDNHMTVT